MHLNEKMERQVRTTSTKYRPTSGPSFAVHKETAAETGAQTPITILKTAILCFCESCSCKIQGKIRAVNEGPSSTMIEEEPASIADATTLLLALVDAILVLAFDAVAPPPPRDRALAAEKALAVLSVK